MSINSGLFAGVAAVAAQSTAFAVISDNIANVNTVGFKDSTTQFQALVTQSLSTSATARGVTARTETNPIKHGVLERTASKTADAQELCANAVRSTHTCSRVEFTKQYARVP